MDWRTIVRAAFARRGRRVDDGVIEELAQHAAAAWAAARAEGRSAAEAEAAIRALIDDWCGHTAGPARVRPIEPLPPSAGPSRSIWAGLGLDVRHALRLFRRQPWFATVSVAMVALGVAAVATIFSVVNGVLLRPLPWPNADRLVRLSESREGGTVNLRPVFSNAVYKAWEPAPATLERIGGYSETSGTMMFGDRAERVPFARITPGIFEMLGVSPLVGAGFAATDGGKPLAVLSYAFWRDRFSGDRAVLGQSMRVGDESVTIVGVMPSGFMFPRPEPRFWMPADIPTAIVPGGGSRLSLFDGVGLLRAGATPAQAAEEGTRLARALPDLGPVIPAVFGSQGPASIAVVSLTDALVGDVRPALWLLLAAVVLLWMAATGNVASMQLAHAVARRREVALRAAIGAGVGRLVRQLVIENALLAFAGGAVGIVATSAALRALPNVLPADFPRADAIVLDVRVWAAAFGLSTLAALVVAILPARLAAALDVRAAIAGDAETTRHRRLSLRGVIVAGQVAVAAALLVDGALLTRSFVNMWRADRGYDGENVLTALVRLPPGLPPAAQETAFAAISDRLAADPRVRAVGISDDIPLAGRERRFASVVALPGKAPVTISALHRTVQPGYFRAMGMRLTAGRDLAATDTFTSEPVIVVNRTFAKKYLGASPVGEVLPLALDNDRQDRQMTRVVGIVEDAQRANVTDPVQPEIFVSGVQLTKGGGEARHVVVRASGHAEALAGAVRDAVRSVNPKAVADQVLTMDARLLRSLARPRLFAILFAVFAVLAALVAIGGLYGSLSYAVSQRGREIGIRMALGASPSSILALVLAQGAVVTAVGVIIGLAAAAAGARAIAAYLFGVPPGDVGTYGAVAVIVATVAVIASAVPARRAARIDPLLSLKR